MPENWNTYQPATITAIREEVPGVKTIFLGFEPGKQIPYVAGQFITFAFSHHGKEERRSYSISSCPDLNEPFSFTLKRLDNGAYSRMLADRAKPGDILSTTGAAGLFTLPAAGTGYRQVFFFAAGIGITPMLPLLKTLLHTQPGIRAVLIYSNSARQEVVFYDELYALQQQFPATFLVEFLYSTAFDLARARLSKALVPKLLAEYGSVDRETMLCYVCGPYSYMRMVIYALEESGIRNNQIKRENFNTSDRVVRQLLPPDKETHIATISFKGKVYNVPVTYPQSILQAAKAYGIQLPYSCEVGRCGSCAAICTSGKVWHAYNEVLTDNELQHGSLLTCTGHPIGGDIAIKL